MLLVEGFAEQVLLPKLAEALDMDLDKLGISVCAIHGTHFGAYAQFCEALGIPWAIITDGDIDNNGISQGEVRARALVDLLGETGVPGEHGIFVGERTFEYDVLVGAADNNTPCFDTLTELCAAPSVEVIRSWGDNEPGHNDFMRMINNAGGKGRYAQRLALRKIQPPEYVIGALRYLEQQ